MITDINSINNVVFNTNLKSLSSEELNDYNGGGFLTEAIAWLAGAWSVHSERIQMSGAERAAFIEQHGLRDHY